MNICSTASLSCICMFISSCVNSQHWTEMYWYHSHSVQQLATLNRNVSGINSCSVCCSVCCWTEWYQYIEQSGINICVFEMWVVTTFYRYVCCSVCCRYKTLIRLTFNRHKMVLQLTKCCVDMLISLTFKRCHVDTTHMEQMEMLIKLISSRWKWLNAGTTHIF